MDEFLLCAKPKELVQCRTRDFNKKLQSINEVEERQREPSSSLSLGGLLHAGEMDQIMNKVGSYWLGQKANKEFNSVGDDFNVSFSISFSGKMQKPLPELLKEFGLPVGIFPQEATNYEFNEETSKLTVFIPEACEVGYRDSSVMRFSTTVSGYLEKGKLAEVEGLKTKVMIWVKVSCISADASKVYFTAGMKKSRSRDAYEVIRPGVAVDKF
ncbi:unnamed protein product [Brassica rapa]|uniref:DUF538 family protein n=1 Tax=Brassica campestris TaxID=3711 RepID=A0A8D9HZG8_BRACM|nr:unnamed protein product [Brassica rapa]